MDVASEIRRGLELLMEPGQVFEVRAPDCRNRPGAPYTFTAAGYFADLDRAAAAIAESERSVYTPAIYVTLNPVVPDLLARADHQIKAKTRDTTKDDQIVRRRWLLIDVDSVRPTGISATDDELDAARQLANRVGRLLAGLHWPEPIFACSGNGYHLFYRVDLPADDHGLIQRVLAALADRFNTAGAEVDRTVHNASRIVKTPGTLVRKGDEIIGLAGMADRSHRRSSLIYTPDALTAVAIEQLEAICGTHPTPLPPDDGRFPSDPNGVQAWLEARGVVVKGQKRRGSSTLLLLERCPINPAIESTGRSDIAIIVDDDGKLGYANKHNRAAGYTWQDVRDALDPDRGSFPVATDVALSHFRCGSLVLEPAPAIEAREPQESPDRSDPGPLPAHLLEVPGFIGEVVAYNLETAPYPNPVMAFAGALALQAFLAGRKVRDPGDNRTNIYLLGLAHSAAGKDWPRKVNTRVMHEVGLAHCLGEHFSSGEGIQDAMYVNPCMLFQTDEIDGMLQSINRSKDARHETIMSTLLTMYSASNSVFPMRRKAGKESFGVIDQPNLVILGTAIPNHYYQALSERMLTNGFFARMIILECGKRSPGQEPKIKPLPPRILETAKWWADFQPRNSNLESWHPVPKIVPHTDEAREILIETRLEAEAEYAKAERTGDPVGTTVWGRVNEQARKLALLYAVSENHKDQEIGKTAADWARRFIIHQTRRMLFMAAGHVAVSDFDEQCKRFIRSLRDWNGLNGNDPMPVWRLRRALKLRPHEFRDVVFELEQRQEIRLARVTTKGRPKEGYVLQ